MSKLQELINELCPNGVEYKKLNTICKIYDGTHSTPQYTSEGIKFFSVKNINSLYKTDKYISEEDYKKFKITPQIGDVFMTRIGSIGVCAVVEKNDPIAYYVSLALLRPDANTLNSKYLKYIIESVHGQKELRKRTLVNAVPIKINKDDIGKIQIPLPPLPVQREIVRILDNFTELTTELTARKKQYEYYRDKLLTFGEDVEWTKIGEVCNLFSGGDIPKKAFSKNMTEKYNIPILSNGIGENTLYGFTDTPKISVPCVTISARGTIGYCALRKKPFFPIVRLICAIPKNSIKVEFLKYIIETIKFNIPTSGIPQLTVPMLSKYKIPVPPLSEQQRIVSILDRFDALCNDITTGLPAEIEARQKQYEYYRDKLLTFPEAKN